MSGTKNADMWACGENGLMLHFDGATWTPVDLGTAQSLWAVLALSETDVYVVGGGGFAAHYDGSPTSVAASAAAFVPPTRRCASRCVKSSCGCGCPSGVAC
ncbi:MAG: hypothetical protein P3A28_03640 [Gemmatimonadota bacterium]|nr:hypothetical protein [Gemmatimonadota bacterium]